MRCSPLLLSAALLAPSAYAEIQFNGFLSAIGGIATDEPIQGYDTDITFKQDSLFGLQATADISHKLSITGQLVSRGQNDYTTELAWGYLAYEINSNFRIRMGRFRTPFYTYSDFLEVGYAYPWIEPSNEVYSLQFDNIDGVDVLFNTSIFNAINVDLQAYLGSIDTPFTLTDGQTLETNTRNHIGLSATFGLSDFSLRLSGHNAKLSAANFSHITLPLPEGAPAGTPQTIGETKLALTQLGQIPEPEIDAVTAQINTQLAIEELNTTFLAVGLKYDGEYLFAVAEATNLTFDEGPLAEQKRYLISGGFNIGSATVFASYSEADDIPVPLTLGLDAYTAIAPAQIGGIINILNGVSNTLSTTSETISFGIRYDFEPGAAFKIQYDSIATPDSINNNNNNSNDNITNGLLRLGVDLVF